MSLNYDVPFYSNTPDDTHCWQAALRMVVKYFQPDKEYSWAELDQLTAKHGDLWTWPAAGILWLCHQGYDVKVTEMFDYQRLAHEGSSYIYDEFGPEIGKLQAEHADMKQGMQLAQQLITASVWQKKAPSTTEITQLLTDGYLIICNLNAAKLNEQSGYIGHFVVIKGYDNDHFILHDPGLPPQQNRRVRLGSFESAWAYPDEKAKNIKAIKLP